MSLTKAWSLIAVLAVAALAPRGALAQTADISCFSSFGWMNNTKDQNPCLVAAYLQSACSGGDYTINPLPANTHYIGPSANGANGCQCSTVTYSLISACGDCQNQTYEMWSTWSYNCSTIYNGSYPMNIPTGTAVPHWAYLDVITGGSFDPAAAQLAGDTPESTATGQSTVLVTSTGASASLTPLPSTATGSSTAQSPTSTSGSSNAGAIAGGVVGGVVGIAAIVGLAAWFLVKRRSSKTAPSAAFNNISGDPGYSQNIYSTNPHPFPGQPLVMQQQRLYDPSDPSTFPMPPPTPTVQTTSTTQNPRISSQSQVYSQQPRSGQYTGVPEV